MWSWKSRSWIAGLLLVAHSTNVAQAQEKSLKDELPRIPAKEPKDALGSFSVQKGYSLEIVASEPLVSDPVDACFDEHGRMFITQMHDYPFSHEPTKLNPKGGGKVGAGIVRLLEDTDGDGRMDQSWKFATGLSWPVSVTPYQGGVLVLAPPTLWYFKDTDGDHQADVKEVVFEGFNRDNVQAIANNMKWGLDHRIYAAGASNPTVLSRQQQEVLKLGRADFSFDPKTNNVRHETGGVQWGHSFDDWGRRFVCSNSNHIQQVVFPQRYVTRNPHYSVPNIIRSIGKEGGAAPVFRRSTAEPWRLVRTRRRVADPKFAGLPESERHPIGFFTSAAGVTIYRGAAYPELRGQVFVGDVGGNLVHRKLLDTSNVTFVATRADENVEFIASTDNWFRPCNFVNAPDGTLHVLDMYRETIEHPASIPEDIKEHLDLYSGDDRGRIYRLNSPNKTRLKVESLAALSSVELVAKLESLNAWTRETAHRLIWERQDKAAIESLRKLQRTSAEPLARMHALWSLQGLDAMTIDDVQSGLKDAHPRVREQAAVLSEPFLKTATGTPLIASLVALVTDDDVRVVFQAALSLGEAPASDDQVGRGLATLLSRPNLVPEIRAAGMTSVGNHPSGIALSLAALPEFGTRTDLQSLVRELAVMMGSNTELKPLVTTLTNANRHPATATLVTRLVLAGAAEGTGRRGGSLSDIAKSFPETTRQFLKSELAIVTQQTSPPNERLAALGSLVWFDASIAESITKLLSPTEPQVVQLAALKTLAKLNPPLLASQLLSAWRGYSPAMRLEVLDVLTQSVPRLEALLVAIEKGEIRSTEISPDKRQLLLNHPNGKIKELATRVLGKDINTDRAAIVKAYEGALSLEGSAERGQMTFAKKCTQCHKLGQQGHAVGPEIVSVQNKSPNDLLVAILDPSREAQPAFTAYIVVTKQGLVLNGLIVAESSNSITLRKAEGKEDIVNRSTIDELVSSGKSLMPDGLEKELKEQDIADVIAFIKSLKAK